MQNYLYTIPFLGDGPGSIKTIHSSEEIRGSKNMDRNIQIVDENGDTIVFMEKVNYFSRYLTEAQIKYGQTKGQSGL